MRPNITQALTSALLALNFALVAGLEGSASEPPKGLSSYVMQGKVGPYLIGMNFTVRDYSRIEAGHYYYATKLLDIPLDAKVAGENFTLREPGGGEFHLHLTSNGSARGPLNFYNSTGLQGEWKKGATSYPVKIEFTFGGGVLSRKRWYSDVTDKPDADFERQVQSFVRSVLAGNRAEAARFVSYPLRVNRSRPLIIHNRSELLAAWEQVFTPKVMAKLRDAIPHEMFVVHGAAMISNGTVWFADAGAVAVNPPD